MKHRKRIIAFFALLLLMGLVYYFIRHSSETEQQAEPVVDTQQPEPARPDIDSTSVSVTEPLKGDGLEVVIEKREPQRRQVVSSQPLVPEVVEDVDSLESDTPMFPLLSEGDIVLNIDRGDAIADSVVLQPIEREYLSWESDTLPVSKGIDLLRIKQVGRFDRGIVNYRFMPKGQWTFGVDASFWDFNSENNKLLFTYLDDFSFDARTVSVSPFLGYFFTDNQAVGVKFGYKYTSGYLGNVSIKIDDDVNFSLKELGLREEVYSWTFFHRSYIGLDPGKRFGLFNETALNLGFGNSVFTRGAGEAMKNTRTDIFEAQLGINPGMAVFLMQNVSVECSIGVVGLKYRRENQVNSLGEKGSHTNGGANFKINLFDINLGLIISL